MCCQCLHVGKVKDSFMSFFCNNKCVFSNRERISIYQLLVGIFAIEDLGANIFLIGLHV